MWGPDWPLWGLYHQSCCLCSWAPQPFSCPFLSMWKGHIRRLYWLARYAWSFIRSFLGLLLLVSQWSHGIYHQNHGISRIKLWMVPSRFEYICPSLFYSLYIFHLLTVSSRSCYNNQSKNSTQFSGFRKIFRNYHATFLKTGEFYAALLRLSNLMKLFSKLMLAFGTKERDIT